ncbi:MAG: hypothetical protein NC041_06915 [Bacteroides sp.]|nr:hypothetical protein [Prevotella sp.]MCM1407027.1 hypothetical protein [Treponema brennaborense]MCM1470179.1 hypothetical protein [Bacteroides sp.]
MTNGTDYLSLIREEFIARGIPNGGEVSFCKVKKEITKENFTDEFSDNLIDDDDLPKTADRIFWIPINTQKFPGVCRSMTANQAGYFAIRKCKEQGWDFLEDWECVLSNLEMDL